MTVLTISVGTVFYFWNMPQPANMAIRDQPIGIFDSGVGGISIWKEIHRFLPRENTIYLADSINAPYGPKGRERVKDLAVKNTEILLGQQCKLIVVACNTATTMAIAHLRKSYSIPFIGIEPAIKPAALATRTGKVGVLATKGTLASDLFLTTSAMHAAGITVLEQEGTGLVERIERGECQGSDIENYLAELLRPMVDEGIDHLVLGCTHYPFLSPALNKVLPDSVRIMDCGWPVARQTGAILLKHGLENTDNTVSRNRFYTNGDVDILRNFIPEKHEGIQVNYLDF